MVSKKIFSKEDRYFVTTLCKFLFHRQHRIQQSNLNRNTTILYVPSEQLLVSKTVLFVQPVKTEKNQLTKTSVAQH